jgi:predicted small lipoprotein YifL
MFHKVEKHMQQRTKEVLLSLIFLSAIAVNGCGQKRPLYLPEAPVENKPSATISEKTPVNSNREQG